LPGLVDIHVHLRDQQMAYKEDFTSGTSAAVAGGVTTIVDMPNNQPVTMSVKTLKERMQTAKPRILANVAFSSAFPMKLNEIPQIAHAGAVGFKLYLHQQIGGVNVDDNDELLSAFKAAYLADVPVAVHAEDRSMVEHARAEFVNRRQNDIKAFLNAHCPETEQRAVERVIELSRRSGAHVHVCHVSSELGLRSILKAKKVGCNVTCEVTPHHILLTSAHLKKYGKLALGVPPLREKRDTAYLWRQLKRGRVDAIASDHAPHTFEEKNVDSVWDIGLGMVGLETMLPLLLTQVGCGRLTIKQLVHLTCENPAEVYHIESRGSLEEGSFADITVVDLKRESKIDASKFYSKAKFSPFDGLKVKGVAVKTFVNGQPVMDEGEIVARLGTGRIVRSRVD